MGEIKGYYLPKSLQQLEENLEYSVQNLNEIEFRLPILTKAALESIVYVLKKNRENILMHMDNEELAEAYHRVADLWKEPDYVGRRIALQALPILTGYSKEMIEHVELPVITAMDRSVILAVMNQKVEPEVFKRFLPLDGADAMIRAHVSPFKKLLLGSKYKNLRKPKLVTHITPSNVPGLMEAGGMAMASMAGAASITKTPSLQPIFGSLYAKSIEEVNSSLAETLAVLPWKGGSEEIEDFLFRNSDVVNVVGSNDTINAVKPRVDKLRSEGHRTIGCYHGGKFGLDVIAREYVNEDVAELAVLDGVGYEGYMCASPAFGFYVERGGIDPAKFAEWMAESAESISKSIPQGKRFKAGIVEKLSTALIEQEGNPGSKVFTSPDHHYLVIYDPQPKTEPTCQNRIFRVMSIDDVMQIPRMLQPWKIYLQTVGVAVPNKRLVPFAEAVGEEGITNIRTVGSVSFPKPNFQSWDGKLPGLEFMVEDDVRWVSIDTKDMESEISKAIARKERLFKMLEDARKK